MKNQNIPKSEIKELTDEQLEDIMAEKLAYLFIEQIRIKIRKGKNGKND